MSRFGLKRRWKLTSLPARMVELKWLWVVFFGQSGMERCWSCLTERQGVKDRERWWGWWLSARSWMLSQSREKRGSKRLDVALPWLMKNEKFSWLSWAFTLVLLWPERSEGADGLGAELSLDWCRMRRVDGDERGWDSDENLSIQRWKETKEQLMVKSREPMDDKRVSRLRRQKSELQVRGWCMVEGDKEADVGGRGIAWRNGHIRWENANFNPSNSPYNRK